MSSKRKSWQPKSDEFVEDSDEDEKPQKSKKAKKETGPASATVELEQGASGSNDMSVNTEGDSYVEFGKNRRCTVRIFNKKVLIDLREYYTDKDGSEKPGKKGIALTPEQWEELKEAMGSIDAEVKRLKR